MSVDTVLVTTTIVVPAPSIEDSGMHIKSDEFMDNRFYACSLSHNSAILVGSSHAYQKRSHEREYVLDAAASAFIRDSNGVIIGVKQATADGLGGSPDDPIENQSIAKIAEFSCVKFVHSAGAALETYQGIAHDSQEQSLTLNRSSQQKHDSSCAMAAAKFTYSGAGKYHGELSNMGDTMILVLDKDFNIKTIHPARQIYRGFNMWTPASVQMMTRPKMQHHFAAFEWDASEGDLIISMTDGIWGELPFSTTSDEQVKEFSLDPTKLYTTSKLKSHFPIHTCSLEILTQAMDNTLKKRAELVNLVNNLNSIQFTLEPHTVSEVFAHLRENGYDVLADELYQILFVGNGGDGVIYFQGVDISFLLVMDDLQKRTAGDCSTINMVRLPYHLDELIRAFINYPDNRSNLLKELTPYLNSPSALSEAILRLKQEEVLVESTLLLKDLKTKPVFSAPMLDDLQILLQHFQKVNVLSADQDYNKKMLALTTYMEGIEGPIRSNLFDLIRHDLTPTCGFLDLFFADKRTVFRNFLHTFGPGKPFKPTDYLSTEELEEMLKGQLNI